MPSERARIALCEVGPPEAQAIPRTRAGSSATVSAGESSPATMMAAGVPSPSSASPAAAPVGHAAGLAEKLSQHLVAHAAQVRGAGAQVPVVDRVPSGRGGRYSVGPGASRVLALLRDPREGRVQERVVLEQQQMSVEDRRVVVAGPAGHRTLRLADAFRHRGQGLPQGGHIGRAIRGRSIGHPRGRRPQMPGGADGDAR